MDKEDLKKELIKFAKHYLKTSVRHYEPKNVAESMVDHYLQSLEQPEEQSSGCDHVNYSLEHSIYTACICNDCGKEI